MTRKEREQIRDQARDYTRALSPEEKGNFLIKLYTENDVDYRYLAHVFDCDIQDVITFLKEIDIKRCSCCKNIKSRKEFYLASGQTDGNTSKCKKCIYDKRLTNENWQEYSKKYCKENREALNEKGKKFRQENPDKVTQYNRTYNSAHVKEQQAYKKEYHEKNKDKISEYTKEYHEKNKDKINEYQNNRRRTNVTHRLSKYFSTRLYHSLKSGKANAHWENIVGYTLEELMRHLESKFDCNMTWENYGIYWQIDHIVPVAAFNYITYIDESFKRCWSLKNLQPLKSEINLKKQNQISEIWNNIDLAKELL